MTQPLGHPRVESCCSGADCCTPAATSRRGFLKASSLVGLGVLAGGSIVAGPFAREATGQQQQGGSVPFIPHDKKLSAEWVKTLFAKGDRKVYRGDELTAIGMPCGGVAAGQMYLSGDGRLAHWDIFNHTPDTGPGSTRYVALPLDYPIDQGFELRYSAQGETVTTTLDRKGFPNVTFVGEYPLAWVSYEGNPVRVTLEAFSPFIPLKAADSGLPATVLRYKLENVSGSDVRAAIVGRMENAVARYSKDSHAGSRVNRIRTSGKATVLECSVEAGAQDSAAAQRPPIVFENFEGKDYGKWKITGDAFGDAPATGTIPPQQRVSGWQGEGLVNTYNKSDDPTGKAVSPEFKIDRPFINFLIGGGRRPGKTCLNLVIDGKVVRTAMGRNNERLDWQTWSVKPLIGKTAHLEIVDDTSGPWGHVNVDQIEFSDRPPEGTPLLSGEPDSGTLVLAAIGDATGSASRGASGNEAKVDLLDKLVGELSQEVTLKPGESKTLTFVLAWHFPNHLDRGKFYATRFADAAAVAAYVADHFDRLYADTKLWHDTYYDSTLPHWFLDRVHMPVANLATSTCQWWQNGRFWAWEGVGCCHGTCTHVWNYEHAMARLFPELERSVREKQDFGPAFHEDGLVGFRGEDQYAADGQAGTVLKAYREHLCSADDAFLRRSWPRIKRATEYLIRLDENRDGLIEALQHNTYDINFFGANTFVGALYFGALRAAEEMAKRMGDTQFASLCRQIFAAGSKWSDEKLFDGEYYIQIVDLEKHPRDQYGRGCLSDQVFGQNWATQLGLGYLYKPENVRAALKSVYTYNWTPDIGAYNEKFPPERWFARPGEAGLFTCTWPKSEYLQEGVRYREEVWTGIEYQVASHMIAEGMLEEGFAIVRGVHERYDGKKHNPWNEIECGDHYARALASWSCLTNLAGFEYDGPAGRMSFDPKQLPGGGTDFRCAFTGAEGWGTYAQDAKSARVKLAWGTLRLDQLGLPQRPGKPRVTLNGKPLDTAAPAPHNLRVLSLGNLTFKAGDELVISFNA